MKCFRASTDTVTMACMLVKSSVNVARGTSSWLIVRVTVTERSRRVSRLAGCIKLSTAKRTPTKPTNRVDRIRGGEVDERLLRAQSTSFSTAQQAARMDWYNYSTSRGDLTA